MKIYFSSIRFNDRPIVWELNEKTHQATCLYYCLKKEDHLESHPPISIITLDTFENIPGITINDREVTIKDIRNFDEPFNRIDDSVEHNPVVSEHHSSSRLRKQNSSFFRPTAQLRKTRDIIEHSEHLSKRSLSTQSLPFHGHIILSELIKNNDTDSTLWGDTVAYEAYFEQKTHQDAKSRRAIFLKSAMSFNVLIQYEKNNRLYPLKSRLIKEIRGLLDVLDPIYMIWCTSDSAHSSMKSVYRYFQNAVLDAMLNARFNNKATEFEGPYPEQTGLSPALREYAIAKARALRAELMIMRFNILVHPELPLELALSEKELKLIPVLDSLRELVLKQPQETLEDIKLRLKGITDLIIQSGIVEESNLQLSDQLNRDLDMKKPVIMDFHSFQSLLHHVLAQQIIGDKKALIPDIVSKVARETIKQINVTFNSSKFNQCIAPLSNTVDRDFYLCQKWADELQTVLTEVKLKHPKEDKKVSAYAQTIASKVIGLLHHLLQEPILTLDDSRVATSSTLTM